MTVTFLGLGSNMGDREENLLNALARIHETCNIIDYSSIYNTVPVGFKEQGDFLNMVVKVDIHDLSPMNVLRCVKKIEKDMGRQPSFRWGPRPIDIDILYIEGVSVDTDLLTIPHKEMFNRYFVLVPLLELVETITINGVSIRIEERIGSIQESSGESAETALALYKSRNSYTCNGQN
jgi:2-amino-4-hydroxy-6-hydroxymethyldihydropteridine diphosphokinase